MKGDAQPLIKFFDGSDKRFIIPLYQRNYDWKEENCEQYQEDERKVKLKPIKKDMQAFDALLYKPKDQYIKESNVTRNYDFFYDKIIHCGLTIDELFETIKKLEVINIRLDEDDDPQLIFESLNSTGLDLSEADKIRNYLLMSLAPVEQDDLYTRYWNPIEEFTNNVLDLD